MAAFEAALTDLCLGPDEGLGFVVVRVDVGFDVFLKLPEACEGGAAERLPLARLRTVPHPVELGRTCRREMELHIGMGLEPVLILLAGVEVVEDDAKLSARKGHSEAIREIEKLDTATAF